MTSLADVKKILESYFSDMGLEPHNLLISSYDAEKEKDFWELHGSFKQGFMGENLVFDARYRISTDTVSKCKVVTRD